MELPNELVDEILTRVPVKYLLRCRCVSKQWCYVIDSTEFVEKYLKVSVERNRGGVIIQGSAGVSKKYMLADLESFDEGSEIIDIGEEVGGIIQGAKVIGSANGLVCLTYGDNLNSVVLLNPCTRKWKKLPVAGTEFLKSNDLCMYMQAGIGYDRVGDDYKVVLVGWCNLPTEGVMAMVYSLKKDVWTPTPNVFRTENIRFFDMLGTFSDGALLWRGYSVLWRGLVMSKNVVVVGFDLGLERFTEAQCCHENVQLVDISIEKSRVEEILANPEFRSFRSTRILMYSKSLEKILLGVDYERLMWYDFRSKAFKNVTFPGIPSWFFSHRYIESLFPLIEDREPSNEAKEKNQQPKKRFLTIVFVLGSIVGSLMFFSRSRRGT